MLTDVVSVDASQPAAVSVGAHATGGIGAVAAPLAIQCKVNPWQRQAPTRPQRTPVLSWSAGELP